MKIIVTKNYEAMSRQVANILSAQVILHPKSVLGLATGSTPIGVYKQLIHWYNKGDIDFSNVTTINLDEYCNLSPTHPQSYRYFMNDNLFNHININMDKTFVPNGMADDFVKEARNYDSLIEQNGGVDMQLLGIGHNGHIGFNEPNEAFEQTTHLVTLAPETIQANQRFFENAQDIPRKAITMGIKAIMQSKKIILAVSGKEKAEILYQSLYGPITPCIPASILQLHAGLIVVADEAALSVINRRQSL